MALYTHELERTEALSTLLRYCGVLSDCKKFCQTIFFFQKLIKIMFYYFSIISNYTFMHIGP